MKGGLSWIFLLVVPSCLRPLIGYAQLDPYKRELIELGYNGALEGRPPISAYGFYYLNEPDYPRTNLTTRVALAPTYLDSELGIRHVLGENTDLGIGLAGGGFADSYAEIQQGVFDSSESFNGYGGGMALSLYHLFNPGHRVPLYGMVRGLGYYSAYGRDDKTASNFELPPNHGTFGVRTGLRWGGIEPVLFPAMAMEVSGWYEGLFRTASGTYGFGDRTLQPQTHLFWGQAMMAYTLPELQHRFSFGVTAGTSINADRISGYRLGAVLPLIAEYPLSLPGYYYQEISASEFALIGGTYMIPIDHRHRWNVLAAADTGWVNYLPGLEQSGHWHTGVGGGIYYNSPAWKVMVGYGYGVNAIRSRGLGAQSVLVLLQIDLGEIRAARRGSGAANH